MKANVTASGKRLLDSGTLILDEGEREWALAVEDLSFTFRFAIDLERGPHVREVSIGEKSATLELMNFNSATAVTYVMPDAFTIDGATLTVGISVQTVAGSGGTSRVISYSLRG